MNAVAECQQRGLEWRKNDQQGTFSFLNQKDGPILALSARLWRFCGIKQLSFTPPPQKDASMPPHGWDLFVSRPTRPTHISCWSQFPNFHFPARTRPRCRQTGGNCSVHGPLIFLGTPTFQVFSQVKRCLQCNDVSTQRCRQMGGNCSVHGPRSFRRGRPSPHHLSLPCTPNDTLVNFFRASLL